MFFPSLRRLELDNARFTGGAAVENSPEERSKTRGPSASTRETKAESGKPGEATKSEYMRERGRVRAFLMFLMRA